MWCLGVLPKHYYKEVIMSRIQLFKTDIGVLSHEACSLNVCLGTRKLSYTSFDTSFKKYCEEYGVSEENYNNVLNLYQTYIKSDDKYYLLIPVWDLEKEVITGLLYTKKYSTLYQPYNVTLDKKVFTELGSGVLQAMYSSAWRETGEEYSYLVLEVWENDKVIQFADRTVFFYNYYSMKKWLYGILRTEPIEGVMEYNRDYKEVFV